MINLSTNRCTNVSRGRHLHRSHLDEHSRCRSGRRVRSGQHGAAGRRIDRDDSAEQHLRFGAVTQHIDGKQPTPALTNTAAVHGYHVTFAVSAIALVAVICGLLVRRVRDRAVPAVDQAQTPVAVH